MERYKRIYKEKNWITIKLSEIEHVKELQAITYIYNNLKNQNNPFVNTDSETKIKIIIQKILGLLKSELPVDKISKMVNVNSSFIEIILTLYQYGNQGGFVELEEGLRLSDLTKSAGLSDFSKPFAKETNKLMGPATKHSRLIQAKINKGKDYVTFIWLTERTPKYKDNFHTMSVDPNTLSLKPDTVYEIEIRILNFFKLLQQRADKTGITDKDIEDVLYKADIQIFDSTPSFQFQGSNYLLTMFDASIVPEYRPPKVWGPRHDFGNLLSKHSASILNSIKFYLPIMRQMIKKYLNIK